MGKKKIGSREVKGGIELNAPNQMMDGRRPGLENTHSLSLWGWVVGAGLETPRLV